MSKSMTTDIHSYTVFANIDDRKGSIKGYQVLLSPEQYEAIEEIVLSSSVQVNHESTYELER